MAADREQIQDRDTPVDTNEAITTADGAVRQLEKATAATQAGAGASADDPGQGEVIPLRKERGGAPEEAAAGDGGTGGEN